MVLTAPFTFTVTSTVPAACGSVRTVQEVLLLHTTDVPATPPASTSVSPGIVLKPEPVTAIVAPPATLPVLGETLVTVGGGAVRPIPLALCSANQRLPSGPAVIPSGKLPAEMPLLNSAIVPLVVMRPMRLPALSVNHRLPSGPAVMPISKPLAEMPLLNSVMVPAGVMLPMRLPLCSVNPMLPSGPDAMPFGKLLAEMPLVNSVTVPVGVMRPMRPADSVNQRLPSGPALMSVGPLL